MDIRKEAPCPGRPSREIYVATNVKLSNTTSRAQFQPSDNLDDPPAAFEAWRTITSAFASVPPRELRR